MKAPLVFLALAAFFLVVKDELSDVSDSLRGLRLAGRHKGRA